MQKKTAADDDDDATALHNCTQKKNKQKQTNEHGFITYIQSWRSEEREREVKANNIHFI